MLCIAHKPSSSFVSSEREAFLASSLAKTGIEILPPKRYAAASRQSRAGFSLVEVVIAVGIVAFAFIPLLGLVPMGLNASRQAIDTTVEAQIIQQMTSEALQTDFSTLSTLNNSALLYFDANGNVTSSASSAIYKACFSVPTGGTQLPGMATGTTTQQLTTVTIYILSTRTAGGMAAQSQTDLSGNSSTKQYFVYVANNGL